MRAAGRFSIPKVLVLVALGALGLAARPAADHAVRAAADGRIVPIAVACSRHLWNGFQSREPANCRDSGAYVGRARRHNRLRPQLSYGWALRWRRSGS